MALKQHPILSLRDDYLKSARTPVEHNLQQINQELIQLIQHSAVNSSFWRKRLPTNLATGNPDALAHNISLLPLMTRPDVQGFFDQMQVYLTKSSESDYLIAATSGSTGNPVRITKYLPIYELEYHAVSLLEWRWYRRDIKKNIVKLRLGGSGIKQLKWNLPLSLLGDPAPGFEITYDDTNIDVFLELMSKLKPIYLYGAPSTLTNLGRQIQLLENPIPFVDQILTAGESLQSWQRELFLSAFPGVEVIDRYSSEEFGYLAIQCPRSNHLHVIAPNIYLEILNQNNEPCEIGEVGRVVVTGLHTFAQPLIRYEIGDLASWAEPTGCGITWPALGEIEGRTHEFKLLPDGTTRRITFARTKFIEIPKIRDFQIFLFENQIVGLFSTVSALAEVEKELIKTEVIERVKLNYPVEIRETSLLPLFRKSKRNSIELVSGSYQKELTDNDLIELVEPKSA